MRVSSMGSAARWIRATLMASMLLSLPAVPTGCHRRVIVVTGEARVVKRLPNGNYEVTPAFLYERARYELELEERLRACEEGR